MSRIHRFSVLVKDLLSHTAYEDNGFIILPASYQESGEKTRLVISCHGAGGTVTTDDSQTEHQVLTRYLVANGYAVMDVGGLPPAFAEKEGIDINNNIGCPLAIQSYVNAYHYVMARFNLYREVFVHGASMGGISSTNLVLSQKIPVIAHTAFCPVLDTYNQIFLHPWSGGLPKIALGKLFGLATDENNEYIYDEEKIRGFNPIRNPKVKAYPVPVKFWHCCDDPVVSPTITEKFISIAAQSGKPAEVCFLPYGGHEPQLFGVPVPHPMGNIITEGEELVILPAVEGVFSMIRSFDRAEKNM